MALETSWKKNVPRCFYFVGKNHDAISVVLRKPHLRIYTGFAGVDRLENRGSDPSCQNTQKSLKCFPGERLDSSTDTGKNDVFFVKLP
ncbi:MAG: hypothetical protein ACLFSH_05045 [Phormidium sp.]